MTEVSRESLTKTLRALTYRDPTSTVSFPVLVEWQVQAVVDALLSGVVDDLAEREARRYHDQECIFVAALIRDST